MFKKTLCTVLALLIFAVPTLSFAQSEEISPAEVSATISQQIPALSEAEAIALLNEAVVTEDGQPLQVAVLSLEEMKETEGALLKLKLGPIGIKLAHHGAHHYFPKLRKHLPHIQATVWRVGVKGATIINKRIPLPARFTPKR